MSTYAIASAAALGVLLFGLGLAVSIMRFRTRTGFGHSSDPHDLLCKMVRAHGNTAEYAPFLAALMLYLGSRPIAPWEIWVMVAVTLCRYLLVAGIILSPTLARPHPLRFVGALGTYLGGLALSLALLAPAR
jgi:uncharacterized membrane protein YecN with MAPEG domain